MAVDKLVEQQQGRWMEIHNLDTMDMALVVGLLVEVVELAVEVVGLVVEVVGLVVEVVGQLVVVVGLVV